MRFFLPHLRDCDKSSGYDGTQTHYLKIKKFHIRSFSLAPFLPLEPNQIYLLSLLREFGIPIPIDNRPGLYAVLKGMDDLEANALMGSHGPVVAQGNGGNRKIMGGGILLPIGGIQFVKQASSPLALTYTHLPHDHGVIGSYFFARNLQLIKVVKKGSHHGYHPSRF